MAVSSSTQMMHAATPNRALMYMYLPSLPLYYMYYFINNLLIVIFKGNGTFNPPPQCPKLDDLNYHNEVY